ncbi:MAG: hypothetical protein OEZ36_05520 [Spirochaetota bacterium]|nr:hypothetical protein [Spirochaetota bacterium]
MLKKSLKLSVTLMITFIVSILNAQYETPDRVKEVKTESLNMISPFYQRKAERFNLKGVHFVNSDVYFMLKASDYGTGIHHIQYAIDDKDFQVYTSPFRVLEQGNRLIRVRAIDNSGNIEKTVLYKVYVDNTSPRTEIAADREVFQNGSYHYCTKRHNFFIRAVDNDSGSGVRMTYGGFGMDRLVAKGTGISKKDNFFTLAQEGVNEYYYTALDNVGNMTPVKKYNIIVDNTPPVVSIDRTNWTTIPTDAMKTDVELRIKRNDLVIIPVKGKKNTYFVNRKHTVAFTARDPRIGVLNGSGLSTIYIKVNDEQYVKYSKSIKFTNADKYVISVKAQDNAGNVSEPVTFTFILDFDRPESSIRAVNDRGEDVQMRGGSGSKDKRK